MGFFSRRSLLGGLILASTALSAAISGGALAQTPTRGGVLTQIVQPEPPMLTTAFNTAFPIGQVAPKMIEGLLSVDLDMKLQPELAESWEITPDGKTITFKLRKGVKWHDGKDFTSADVEFSINKIWKVLHPRGRSTFAKVTAVETPDSHTVIFRLSDPAPFMMPALAAAESQVMPKHIYDGKDIQTNPANNAPIGTGPFMFKEWQKGNFVQMVRNPNYWKPGLPYLDGVVVRFINDAAGRAAALETGEAHIAGASPVPLNDVERLRGLPHLGVETRGYDYFSPMYLMEFNLRKPPFNDKRVRQAVAHAINTKALVQVAWYGFGTPATGPVPQGLKQFYTTDGVPQYAYDRKKAEELLDAAGLKRQGSGPRLKVVLDYIPYGADHLRTAEFIKQQLQAVGIEIEIRSQDVATWLRRIYTDNDFDLTTNFFSALPDPTLGVQRIYWSKNIQKGVVFSNGSGYVNPEMDAVLEAAQVEVDPAKRQKLFHRMQQIAQTDLPVLDLFVLNNFTIYNKKVGNHTKHADGLWSSFADMYIAK